MDEDDSQDELINRSTSHSRGKRAALWAISDDSDDSEEEGDSDSEEEEQDGHINGDDEEEDEGNEEEDDEEEEEDAQPEDGGFEGSSADLAVISSDEDADRCPICLNSLNTQPVATPESCEHYFCFDCILEWAKNANSCPVDRIAFNSIYLRKCYGGKVKKMITVQKPVKEGQEETVDLDLEQTNCEVCGGSDREDRLLLCDGCDAGYHMECLTPPLDSVPVEEWFCPECEANNRNSRGSAEELSDYDSLPSTARPATSRSRAHVAGPTRAIARTQQSERVRANVNRHRITQARTSQLAPTYLIQSTWLDDTINAVVAGLNTSVYIRDLTPRVPSSRKRKAGKRRRVKNRKTSSAKNGKVPSTGVKRRKRKRRRTKSRKKMMLKNVATPRSRIANSLGIVKDKKSSSLPTVYRPSEHTLSSMRADIGAASLSIYGDAFDLDPFVDCEEDEQQAHVSSLLEAKRRGISCSALRSHQPVARPVTASLSRRSMDVHQSGGVVEAAPVPDLLGSILSGQSMLLMDSSDVVINRDGSLKATKPMMSSALIPGSSKSSSSGDANIPGISANLGDSSQPLNYNRDQPGPSCTSVSTPLSQSSSRLPPFTASSTSHTQTPLHPDLRAHPGLHPPCPNRPTPSPNHWGSNGFGASRESFSSVCTTPESSSKNKGMIPTQSQPKKAPTKPMWVDVSVLPRIPKIKRESSGATNDGTSQGGSHKGSSSRGHSSSSTRNGNGYGTPETGMNNLSGDKGRQQSVDQQKGQADGQAQRHRHDGGSSSSAFSNSFSSSSSTGCPASQPRYASSSSSSSVSFRINSSGNPWQSRRLGIASSSSSGGTFQEHWRKKEDEAKKRQLDRDKQMLLASRSVSSKEQDNIYDPFNPTLSDSSSSGDEAEGTSLNRSSQHVTLERKSPSLSDKETTTQNKQDLVQVKTETPEIEISQEEPGRAQKTTSEVRLSEDSVRVKEESRLADIKTEKQTVLLDIKVKKEPCDDTGEPEICGDKLKSSLNLETLDTTPPTHQTLDLFKTERETEEEKSGQCTGAPSRSLPKDKEDSSAINSATVKRKQKEETKSLLKSCSKSPSRDLDHKKKSSKALKEQPSSGSETDRGRRGDHHTSGQGGKQKERDRKEKERSSRRSRSRERRRAHSSSDSSQPKSPDRTHRKRRRSQSQSKDETRRRRSRSASSSSSKERSRRKKHKQRSMERNDDRERDHDRRRVSKDKRRGRSHSKSQSKSRSRSRTRSRSRDRKHGQSQSRSRSRERKREHNKHSSLSSREKVDSRSKEKRRHRSRSSSRERRKEERTSKSSHQTLGPSLSSSKSTKQLQDKRKEKDVTQSYTKDEKVDAKVKEGSSCSFTSKVKKEDKVLGAESQSTNTGMTKETKARKEIKKEKRESLDMFEDVPVSTPIKREETDTSSLAVSENLDIEDPIKTETCEIPIVKSEPSSICSSPPDSSFSTLATPVAADSHQNTVSQSQPVLVAKHQNTELAVPVKLEVQQPSDSDDDFNIDVMLDNLDYVKSEHTESSGAAVKQEKEVVEEKIEAEQVSTIAGVKSKTQVKRVTWNIQEPEGRQPEKSASKLALYKLKLKQEGARRPSLTVQAPSQDITADDSDPSKKGADGLLSTSKSDGLHPGELSAAGQGEAEEGDLSRKDKYLKKLHMQERAIEEVKLAIKPFYQRRDINKDEYKEILRKAVQKVCHSKSGEINPVKVGNLVKAYVDKYKHARKHKKEDLGKAPDVQTETVKTSDSPQ